MIGTMVQLGKACSFSLKYFFNLGSSILGASDKDAKQATDEIISFESDLANVSTEGTLGSQCTGGRGKVGNQAFSNARPLPLIKWGKGRNSRFCLRELPGIVRKAKQLGLLQDFNQRRRSSRLRENV